MLLGDRIAKLEDRLPKKTGRYHWIIGEPGETTEMARARYERDEGALLPDDGILFWRQFTGPGGTVPCHN